MAKLSSQAPAQIPLAVAMSDPSTPPAKRKRVHTASQLEQKRLADRVKHRENRHENKNRLDKMETDIADIKSALQSLVTHFQSRLPSPTLPDPTLSLPCPNHRELELLRPRHGALCDSPTSTAPQCLLGGHGLGPGDQGFEPQALTSWQQGSWSTASAGHKRLWTPTPSIQSKLLNCQCGSQHLDRFDCVDQCNITTFYQQQIATFPIAVTRSPTPGVLPRNPSLPSMMLHSMDENIATFLITGFLRQYRNKGIEQLLSFYLLGYRYMRVRQPPPSPPPPLTHPLPLTPSPQWQMSPCEETIRDIPAWMLPTDIQRANPHSVIVDYIPWPRLRDYLCTSGDEDAARSVYFYFESTQFLWPAESPVFAQSEGGEMAPSPEFERAVGKLEHWRIGAPWSETFPHLLHLVEPEQVTGGEEWVEAVAV